MIENLSSRHRVYVDHEDPESLKREAMLTGQVSFWLWDQQYFRGASFLHNLKCSGFQFEYSGGWTKSVTFPGDIGTGRKCKSKRTEE